MSGLVFIIYKIVLSLLKMQMILQWRCQEQKVAGALYNVNKYATDALNTEPEMISDRST